MAVDVKGLTDERIHNLWIFPKEDRVKTGGPVWTGGAVRTAEAGKASGPLPDWTGENGSGMKALNYQTAEPFNIEPEFCASRDFPLQVERGDIPSPGAFQDAAILHLSKNSFRSFPKNFEKSIFQSVI